MIKYPTGKEFRISSGRSKNPCKPGWSGCGVIPE